MGSDDRDSAVYAPFDAIKRHYGYLHRIKDIGEALQLAPKVITGPTPGCFFCHRQRAHHDDAVVAGDDARDLPGVPVSQQGHTAHPFQHPLWLGGDQ
jgi:hypothetical protein